MITFKELFEEYFTLYRGQAVSIPSFGDREFTTGVRLCNNAIRKWERVDGQLWNELITTLQTASDGDKQIIGGKTEYDCPADMRKPPGVVNVFTNDQYHKIDVVKPENLDYTNELTSMITFIGSANIGYKMVISDRVSQELNGKNVDYVYNRKATYLSTTVDPSETNIDMSDPNFAIQDMLASRFMNARNGFGYKIAASEASKALMNMKIENESGVQNKADSLKLDGGWGTSPDGRIRL